MMNKCIIPTCNCDAKGEMFCQQHDQEGWHSCYKCGALIRESIFDQNVGDVICKDCFEKLPYDTQIQLAKKENRVQFIWNDYPRIPHVCDTCKGKGWEIFSVLGSEYYPEGHQHIERCGNCSNGDYDDLVAEHDAVKYITTLLQKPDLTEDDKLLISKVLNAIYNELAFAEKRLAELNLNQRVYSNEKGEI